MRMVKALLIAGASLMAASPAFAAAADRHVVSSRVEAGVGARADDATSTEGTGSGSHGGGWLAIALLAAAVAGVAVAASSGSSQPASP